jgi:hypothetical protein
MNIEGCNSKNMFQILGPDPDMTSEIPEKSDPDSEYMCSSGSATVPNSSNAALLLLYIKQQTLVQQKGKKTSRK